jgi:glycerol-3-phosphate acyltransferase PlsY
MSDEPFILLGLLPLAAYAVGSTPFGVLIARSKGIDLRKHGSGNVGATNCGRVCGRKWGCLCFVLDVGKGLLPVLLVGWLVRPTAPAKPPGLMQQAGWLLTGCGAVAGHVFSFWLRFRGGKGVATALGVVVGIWPYFTCAGLIALGVWVLVTLASRYVSLGSITAAVVFLPAFAALNWPPTALWPMGAFAALMVALILVRHRSNIRRLLNGTENRIGRKQPSAAQAPPP